MQFIKTLEATPGGAELQSLYMRIGALESVISEIHGITLADIDAILKPASEHVFKHPPNEYPLFTLEPPDLKNLVDLLVMLRRAIACTQCNGSKTYEPGDEEIYRCPACNGVGRRIRYHKE